MKRAYAEHTERQWQSGMQNDPLTARLANKGLANSAESVYWSERYPAPPKIKRRGGHLRLLVAVAVLACGPSGLAYLSAMRVLSEPLAVIGALLLTVGGTYLMMTVEDID